MSTPDVKQEKPLAGVSEEFWDAITHGGTYWADCGFCGRSHYNSDIGQSDCLEDEVAKLLADPKAIEHSGGEWIRFGVLDGKQVVYGCCPDKVARYEQFIWNHRYLILRYLKDRSNRERREAGRLSDAIREVGEG